MWSSTPAPPTRARVTVNATGGFLDRALDVKAIVFTQSHPDHIGGWSAFADDGAETIAQRWNPEIRVERTRSKISSRRGRAGSSGG